MRQRSRARSHEALLGEDWFTAEAQCTQRAGGLEEHLAWFLVSALSEKDVHQRARC
jgi:hypothetical protein